MHTILLEPNNDKVAIYEALLPQMAALIKGESDSIANQANFVAALKEAFQWWWVGFYFVKDQELVLGPFQGPVACTRIAFGKGVCGKSWELKEPMLVPDVHLFPGHIACSAASQSELVLPILGSNQEVIGVLEADSQYLNHFDDTDIKYLNELLTVLFASHG